jgi:uncharacterized repeat protein (TIGR01451 family)
MKNWTRRRAGATVGLLGALVVALALVGAAAADHGYQGAADSHLTVAGSPPCPVGTTLADVEPAVSGTYGDGAVELDVAEGGASVAWQLTASGVDVWDMAAVIVGGDENSVIYFYDSGSGGFDDADTGLTAAPNEPGGELPDVGRVAFCVDRKSAGGSPELEVEKTADAAWNRTVGGWNVTKSGQLTTAPSRNGNGEITWSVAWTKGVQVDEHLVSGSITIRNTGNAAAVGVSVDDTLDGDADFVLDCGDWTPGDNLAAEASVTCTYSVLLDGPVDGTNEVTVDAANADPASASDAYDFPSEPNVEGGEVPASVDVVDSRFGYRETVQGGGATTFKEPVTCGGGTFSNTVQLVDGQGEGEEVVDEATAQVVVGAVDCSQPPPPSVTPQIDVQVIKDATPQVTLGANGTAEITYSVVVKNNGPNTANDVVFADGAPSGVEFVPGTLTQGPVLADSVPCTLSASVLNCANLGDMGPGVQTTLSWKATVRTAGTFVNTGTATGTGTDTNPGNNTDDASTVVVAPPVVQPPVVKPPVVKPPVAKPPKPKAICLKLAVRGSKMVSQGKRSAISFKVTRGGKPVAGAAVVLRGAGIYRVVKTNKQGLVIARVAPAKAGIVTATLSPKQVGCNSARVGVVGVFEPPVTG